MYVCMCNTCVLVTALCVDKLHTLAAHAMFYHIMLT